jgi:hypothetical protein
MEKCVELYNDLLEHFKILLKNNINSTDKILIETNIVNFTNKTEEEKYNYIQKFYTSLEQDDLFFLFSNM